MSAPALPVQLGHLSREHRGSRQKLEKRTTLGHQGLLVLLGCFGGGCFFFFLATESNFI